MKPARILLLVVALIAGGLAAFLATRNTGAPPPPRTVTEVVQEQRGQVLVARAPIGIGQRLNPELVEWQDWPVGAIRAEYISKAVLPDAPEEMSDAVARFEFFPGEPILEAKLVRTDQGYLSAVIAPGMRAVSIQIAAESASGGFIIPNDRVDVVLTRGTSSGDISEVILANVRVMAIGARIGEAGSTGAAVDPADPSSQMFSNAIATFELTPAQAETIINAGSTGRLSLVLRSVVDFNQRVAATERRASQSIRVIRFGREGLVMSTNSDPDPAGGALDESMTYDPTRPGGFPVPSPRLAPIAAPSFSTEQ